MSSPSTCIAGPLNQPLPMKTRNKTPTAGVVTRPVERRAWQIISQWVWNLRLELGHQLEPTPVRTTEFAPAALAAKEQQAPSSGYGPPTLAAPWKAGRLSGQDFVLQPDGTLRCPAKQALTATEQRREADGSLRLVYAARISQCRGCPLREQCQWHGRQTTKPRRVSVLLHPRQVGTAPLLVARIGVAGSIAEPAWPCCAPNGLRSPFRRPRLSSHIARRSSFPVRSAPIIASLLKKSPLHRPSQAEVSLPERSAAVPLDSLNGRVGERDVAPFLGDPAPQRTFPLSPDTWSGYLRGDR